MHGDTLTVRQKRPHPKKSAAVSHVYYSIRSIDTFFTQQREEDRKRATDALIDAFLARQLDPPLMPLEVLQLLTEEPKGTRRQQYIQGVRRLLTGIVHEEEEVWVHCHFLSGWTF